MRYHANKKVSRWRHADTDAVADADANANANADANRMRTKNNMPPPLRRGK